MIATFLVTKVIKSSAPSYNFPIVSPPPNRVVRADQERRFATADQ